MAAGVNLQVVRVEETLKIRIGEAKNLPPRKEPRNLRNVYCSICLDQEEVFRTTTVEKSLSPFFGDDVHFEVPKDFRSLCFYLRDADPFYRDTVIGKVAIKKEDLQKYHSDTWFPLTPIDHNSEVQGRIHIAVNQYEYITSSNHLEVEEFSETSSSAKLPKLNIRVIQCSDLFACNGSGTFSDPFVSVSLQRSVSKSDTKKTKVKKRTIDPKFEESFTFSYNPDDLENCILRCTVWSASLIGEDVFLGQVRIPLSKCDLFAGHKGWYWLGPREERANSVSKSDQVIGSLRLRVCYTEDHVFPSSYYDPLRETILDVESCEHVTSCAAHILGEVVGDKVSAARSIVRVFSHHNKVTLFLKSVVDHEIINTTDSNTLFRGNSVVTKAIDEFMKLAGMQYLHDTLKCLIDEIFEDRKPCEIDQARLKEGESLETNLLNLQDYVERLFTAIVCSSMSCPTSMCQIFCNIRESAVKQFKDDPDVRYTAVSGFVFLRFFAPAILNPKLFQMRVEHPDPQTARTLTLASKAIQSLGNLVNPVMFGQVKEPYMENLKSLILDQRNLASVKKYLDIISSKARAQGLPTETPILLKEGILIKRVQGRRRFNLKNYKKRYFVLTDKGLCYSKAKGKNELCSIPVDDILAVEKLGEQSYQLKLMFQVMQPERQLYVQASNSVDEREWIRAIRKVCQANPKRVSHYHPEAYICGRWLCCKERSEKFIGCTPITEVPKPKCFNVVIDCDREIERIHSLILVNLDKLDELYCECEVEMEGLSTSDDRVKLLSERLQSITKLRKHVISMEQEHKQYRKITNRLTRHGSKKCPWGPSQETPDPLKGHIHLR